MNFVDQAICYIFPCCIVHKGVTTAYLFLSHPNFQGNPFLRNFCFPTRFVLLPFKAFYGLIRWHFIPWQWYHYPLWHTNFPCTIALKRYISSNQSQLFKFWPSKPYKYCGKNSRNAGLTISIYVCAHIKTIPWKL